MEEYFDDKLQDNPVESLQEGPTQDKTNHTGSFVKKIIIGVGVLLLGYLIYSVADIFIAPDRHIQQIYLVPDNAAFIIQSSDPVADWRKFSKSEPWQELKKAKTFEEMSQHVEMFDSIIHENKTLLSLVGKRDLLVSVHKTRATDWDFLIILDMQKISKLNLLKDQLELILRMADFDVTHRKYKEINIIEMRNPETRDILYAAFVENHFVASYTSKLVESAIDVRTSPKIGLNASFIEAEKKVAGKGLCRIFINYENLPQFMSLYLGERNEYIDLFCHSMDFAGLYFNIDKDMMEMKGSTFRKEIADPYITALLSSGKHKMKAHEIMSARTAFYTNIGLGDVLSFMKELEQVLSASDAAKYASYMDSKRKIEKLFAISLEENFLSWMSGEFAISQSEPGLLGREPELILAIKAKDIKDAREQMEFIEKKIKSRTPIKVKTVHYKDFEVNYIEMKGFFRLFFGGIFDKFEKPYYTYVEDFVVFSNQPSSILSFIEDYEQKNILKNNADFKKAYDSFSNSSTLFLYSNIHKFYPQLQGMLNTNALADIKSNKDILYSFPHWTMQISGNDESASLQIVMDYQHYSPGKYLEIDTDVSDDLMDEEAETEKELMSELKRFYVEKFQGNVLREFYSDGVLKSESEVKEGKRHGRYREYYENGQLSVRGKFVNNRPKGTWKFYTEDGKFDRKEKF